MNAAERHLFERWVELRVIGEIANLFADESSDRKGGEINK